MQRIVLQTLLDKKLRKVPKKKVIYLSEKAAKRYTKITKDFEKGKNIYTAKDVDDLLRQLHERSLP